MADRVLARKLLRLPRLLAGLHFLHHLSQSIKANGGMP